MADVSGDVDAEHGLSLRRCDGIEFEEDTLRQRPSWVRLIIEFVGTVVPATVAAEGKPRSLRLEGADRG